MNTPRRARSGKPSASRPSQAQPFHRPDAVDHEKHDDPGADELERDGGDQPAGIQDQIALSRGPDGGDDQAEKQHEDERRSEQIEAVGKTTSAPARTGGGGGSACPGRLVGRSGVRQGIISRRAQIGAGSALISSSLRTLAVIAKIPNAVQKVAVMTSSVGSGISEWLRRKPATGRRKPANGKIRWF